MNSLDSIVLKHILRYWAIFGLVMIISVSCKNLEAPVFESVEEVEIVGRTPVNITLSAKVNFYNPNNHKITLKHADIDVLINDKKITNYTRDYDIKIDKHEHFSVPVEITLSLADLNTNIISSAINALLGKQQRLAYKGSIRIKAFGVKIKVPVNGTTDFDLRDL